MKWDLFCRVIDNHGDIGVCWRLAADLAARGQSVRLWLDDASALAWMAPQGAAGIQVRAWDESLHHPNPADVVVEAFGCDPAAAFLRAMAARERPPVWIDLEYLSAEGYVERSHGLPSPQSIGPAAGLTRWFFYPGFSAATGGLIRELDLQERQHRFDAPAWLHARGIVPLAGERIVSLFCYENAALPALLDQLGEAPTLLLATAGLARQQVEAALGSTMARGQLRALSLPYLTQRDYDHLLWSCDLNFVRGEDSFVRAQWAGRPFVWQIYPQHDGVHAAKLEAFLTRFLGGAEPSLASACASLWRRWNGLGSGRLELPDPLAWNRHVQAWREQLYTLPDLCAQLIRLAGEKR
jgi:uncharacterized repeat protein (TIGR03837 family)